MKEKQKIFRVNYLKIKNYERILKNLDKLGLVVIENVISKKKCDEFINILEKSFKKYNKFYFENKSKKLLTHSGSFQAKSVTNLHNKNEKFLKLLDYPIIFDLVNILLKQGSYNNSGEIISQAFAARTPMYSAKEQQLHNDARLVGSKFPIVVQVMWALDPFTSMNGSTRFVLGTHKSNNYPENEKKYKNEIVVKAKKGSIILFNGALWHGSSAVKSKNRKIRRWAIISSYSRWFLKPSYDFQKNTPINIYKKMNITQKDLLGYRYNPPKDEFTGNRSIQLEYEKPSKYSLPK